MFERVNYNAEGEGASFSPVIKRHGDANCLIISNDTDTIIYGILAGVQRQRNQFGEFYSHLWVQIVTGT